MSNKKTDEKKEQLPADGIIQPKKDDHTQDAVRANAQKGESVHTPLGSEVMGKGIDTGSKEDGGKAGSKEK